MSQAQAQSQAAPFPSRPAGLFQVTRSTNRLRVRDFIRHRFAQEYAADIDVYSRHLIALVDAGRRIRAAVGYQSAAEGPLFLEQYLERPVQECLTSLGRRPVSRGEIVEVGNLASHSSGWTRFLILNLAGFFCQQDYRWLVITASGQVLNSFHKLGVGAALIPLTPADPARLQDDPARWGRYYDDRPLVMAANIPLGLARLKRQQGPLPLSFNALPDLNLNIEDWPIGDGNTEALKTGFGG